MADSAFHLNGMESLNRDIPTSVLGQCFVLILFFILFTLHHWLACFCATNIARVSSTELWVITIGLKENCYIIQSLCWRGTQRLFFKPQKQAVTNEIWIGDIMSTMLFSSLPLQLISSSQLGHRRLPCPAYRFFHYFSSSFGVLILTFQAWRLAKVPERATKEQ